MFARLTMALAVLATCAAGSDAQMRTPELVGVPIRAITYGNSHGALARSPQGREGMFYIPYYSTTGGELVGYHADSGELVRVDMPSQGGYGCCTGIDGALYVGGVGPGDMYRYDPASGELQTLGGSELGPSYIWDCDVAPDGKVYGACYPTCNVIEYDPATGQMRDLGRLSPDRPYARSLCVDAFGKVWAGVGMPPELWVIDPASGEREQVLPEQYMHDSSCYELQASGGYVCASVLQDVGVLVYDAQTREVIRHIPSEGDVIWWMLCGGAPAGEQYLYSFPDGDLYHYDIGADELTLLAQGLGQCERVVDGRFVHGIDDQAYFLHDLQTGTYLAKRVLAEATDGMAVQTLTGHPSGAIFGSTYINQHMFGYHPESGAITDLGKVVRVGGQVDSIHCGRDGRIYMGSYVRAHLSIYDPSLPWRPGRAPDSNPRELGEVGHGQYRTQAIALGPDDRVWVGSIPSYNSGPTGAFSVWDPVAEEKVVEIEMPVSSLAVAPDGTVAISSGDDLALFDPEGLEITRTIPSPIGAMSSMVCAPDGRLYGINDGAVAMIDPATWEVTQIAESGGKLLAAGADGSLYFARGARLWRLPQEPAQ